MSSLPTGHVGDLAAALVDDQLDHPLRDLVLRHMIGCVMCRHDVEEQRQLKARLRALAEPGLPLNLFSRLSALNEPPKPVRPVEPAEPLGSPLLGPDDAALLALVADAGPSLGRSPFLRDSHRGRRLLAGAASLLLVGVGTAFAAASDGQSLSPGQPSANVFTTSNGAQDTGSVPFSDAAFSAMTASFSR